MSAKLPFHSLPIIVRFATLLSPFLGWILVAEFVIDRHGLDRYLLFYRVGEICVYDLAAVAGLTLLWFALGRAARSV